MASTPLASDDRDDRAYGLHPDAAQQFLARSEDEASREPQREPPESFWSGETANDEPVQLQLEIGEPVDHREAAREEGGDESRATVALVEADDACSHADASAEPLGNGSAATAEVSAAPPAESLADTDTPAIGQPEAPEAGGVVAAVETTYAPERADSQPEPIALYALPASETNDGTVDGGAFSGAASAAEAPEPPPAEPYSGDEPSEAPVSEVPELFSSPAPETAAEASSSAEAPDPEGGAAKAAAPLVNALDDAVKLAADANAAAEALENLKWLLERRVPVSASAPSMSAPAAPASAVSEPNTPAVRLQPTRPAAPVKPPPLALPPLPLHSVRNADGKVALRPALLPQPRRSVVAERRRFDVRGFFAGFALSWAFGVVLFLFLTAG